MYSSGHVSSDVRWWLDVRSFDSPEGFKFPSFWLDDGGTGFREGSVIRALGGVRHPEAYGRSAAIVFVDWPIRLVESPGVGCPWWSGRPAAVVFWQLLLLVLVLGVLAILPIGSSCSMAIL
jgi:hypothetical protein